MLGISVEVYLPQALLAPTARTLPVATPGITQAANVLIFSPSLYVVLALYTTLGASWETTTFAHPVVSGLLQNVLTESIQRL